MITFKNVCKRFGEIHAVNDLSLSIQRGEIFGLLGPNGAGKTTLVNLAVGLLQLDSGTIELEGGRKPNDPIARKSIGVATQALAIYEDLSAEENVRFFSSVYGLKGTELAQKTHWALEFVSLLERKNSKVASFSGGMKRRLNLACAIVHNPDLIFLDEPTVGVDPQSRNAIFEQIRELHSQGKTLIYITHYMEEAEQLCDRIGIVDHGLLYALGTVQELLKKHGGRPVVTIKHNGNSVSYEAEDPVAKINKLHSERTIGEISVQYPNLERVFLNLTGRNLRD
ncbi:MAG: ABC transporter ATP-binding protein [Acidobacteria bacterium]|nr:ABC transporter ATP-binding protein [Acidobacteriota bacterium]